MVFAVEGLSDLGHQDAIPAITKLLKDSDWRVRASAVYGLQRLRAVSPAVREGLQECLSDPHPQVKEAAETAFQALPPVQQAPVAPKTGIPVK